jgi:hypothetical protein
MKHTIRCRSFRALAKGTLRGFATIHVVELRVAIHDVALHKKGEARWAQLPSKPVVRDGRHIVDEATGKPQYVSILEFDDRETRDAFSARVWRAVAEQYPEVEPASEAPA